MFGALVVLRIVTSLVDVAVPFAAGHLVDTVATAKGHDLRPAVHALAMLLAIVFIYPVHVSTRKSFGLMTRKLSVTESRKLLQFLGTLSRKKSSVASANCPHVA